MSRYKGLNTQTSILAYEKLLKLLDKKEAELFGDYTSGSNFTIKYKNIVIDTDLDHVKRIFITYQSFLDKITKQGDTLIETTKYDEKGFWYKVNNSPPNAVAWKGLL